jgi:hypothetical protein
LYNSTDGNEKLDYKCIKIVIIFCCCYRLRLFHSRYLLTYLFLFSCCLLIVVTCATRQTISRQFLTEFHITQSGMHDNQISVKCSSDEEAVHHSKCHIVSEQKVEMVFFWYRTFQISKIETLVGFGSRSQAQMTLETQLVGSWLRH